MKRSLVNGMRQRLDLTVWYVMWIVAVIVEGLRLAH